MAQALCLYDTRMQNAEHVNEELPKGLGLGITLELKIISLCIVFNRPGVAGAVLPTPL